MTSPPPPPFPTLLDRHQSKSLWIANSNGILEMHHVEKEIFVMLHGDTCLFITREKLLLFWTDECPEENNIDTGIQHVKPLSYGVWQDRENTTADGRKEPSPCTQYY